MGKRNWRRIAEIEEEIERAARLAARVGAHRSDRARM